MPGKVFKIFYQHQLENSFMANNTFMAPGLELRCCPIIKHGPLIVLKLPYGINILCKNIKCYMLHQVMQQSLYLAEKSVDLAERLKFEIEILV